MRVIASEFRGRRLLPPEGDVTRPITDRVKQSLFDILTPRIEGAAVLDLFAGTGNMGLECLSRGAERAHFFDADRSAVARLNKNIAALGIGRDRAIVYAGDLFRWFKSRAEPLGANLIFLDPPYRFLRERPDALRELGDRLAHDHLAADGLLIFRHDAGDALELPSLREVDRRTYGGMALRFLGRGE